MNRSVSADFNELNVEDMIAVAKLPRNRATGGGKGKFMRPASG